MTAMYRAMMVTKAGGPEALTCVELPVVEPLAGQLRVRVRAAGVGSTDLPETMLADRRARLGPGSAEITRAYALNELDDWLAMHEALTRA